jgi:hypothetical protein
MVFTSVLMLGMSYLNISRVSWYIEGPTVLHSIRSFPIGSGICLGRILTKPWCRLPANQMLKRGLKRGKVCRPIHHCAASVHAVLFSTCRGFR